MASVTDRSPPTTAAIAIATAIIAGLGGFFLGQASSLGLVGQSKEKKADGGVEESSDEEDAEGEESENEDKQALGDFSDVNEECKLVLVVRTDLGMTKGKIAAQCGHATLACYKSLLKSSNPAQARLLQQWERYGQAKVALQVKNEDELELLQAQALSLGICAHIIHDAGRTQIASGSATVLGIGPAPKSKIDQVSGHLKLL